jgi:hypothetical protein
VAPAWLRAAAPEAWYKRYAHRVEDHRLPRAAAEREAYARTVGEDGFALLARLDEPGAAEGLRRLPRVEALRQVWARHFVREPAGPPEGGGGVRLRGKADPSAPAVVSPYDPEARYRGRHATVWTGYVVHLSETCDDDTVHLITHAMTTDASVNEVRCTAAIQRALAGKGLAPSEHLVDTAYVDAGSWCAAARSWASPWSARRDPTRVGRRRPGAATASGASRSIGSASGSAVRRAGCPRPGARWSSGTAARTSASCSARPTAAPARRGPRARGPGTGPGT